MMRPTTRHLDFDTAITVLACIVYLDALKAIPDDLDHGVIVVSRATTEKDSDLGYADEIIAQREEMLRTTDGIHDKEQYVSTDCACHDDPAQSCNPILVYGRLHDISRSGASLGLS